MTLSRRTVLKGGAAGAVAAAAPGIRGARAASNSKIMNTVMQGDLRSFDPIWTTANISAYYGAMVYDTLFATDANFKSQPQMVGKWGLSEDKRTYTFELRDGMTWHDATPVTAADCVASIRRWAVRNSGGQMMMEFVTDLSAKDDKTFVLALKQPFGLTVPAFAATSTPDCFMMPKKVAETDPFQQIKSHIGSGPFIFNEKETRPGSRYVFDKFTKYVPRAEPASGFAGGKVVKLDRVVWHNITDDQTAIAALESGEVDFFELPPLDLLPQLQSNPDIKIRVLDKSGNCGTMRLNWLHPPFNNVKARQAMLYLTNQADILKATFGNPKYYNKIDSIFGYQTPMANDANSAWFKAAPDPAKARQLFKEAGYNGEKVIVLQATNFDFMNNSAQLIASWLKGIGVNAELAASTWGGVVSRRAVMAPDDKGGWDIFITYGSGYDWDNPITMVSLSANGKKGWFGWPEDAEYEALRRNWALVSTLAERQAIARKMQTIAWNVVPQVMLGQWVSPVAMRTDVHDLIGMPDIIPFWNVYKT
ncbi:MAG: ABC transporter substrate-binding protein [Acetobacteraceae bacterium]